MEGNKKSNKIREIVRLQQILKKWKKLATTNNSNSSKTNNNNNNNGGGGGGGNKGIKFLKKTLSFSDNNNNNNNNSQMSGDHVPKGYLAVCVGKELKRYVIPTHYLGHQAFGILLREAEEEFGFHQEGVLKIPSEVSVFERVLQLVEAGGSGSGSGRIQNYENPSYIFATDFHYHHYQQQELDVMSGSLSLSGCCSPDCTDQLLQSSHPQLCR